MARFSLRTRTTNAGILLVYSVVLIEITSTFGLNPGGFLSIDCGCLKEYVDPLTNLTWSRDMPYLQTGERGLVSSSAPVTTSFGNVKALKDFIYFPGNRSKYCYELPLASNTTTYLLRIMFFHGDSTVLGQRTKFQIYVNATSWIEVQYGFGDGNDFNTSAPEFREGIFFNPGVDIVNVCLVPEIGIPFLSSLELRKLEESMYRDILIDSWSNQTLFLTNILRNNMALSNTSSVRYPDDRWDRIWEPFIGVYGEANPSDLNLFVPDMNLTESNNLPDRILKTGIALEAIGVAFVIVFPFVKAGGFTSFIFYLYSNQSGLSSPTPVSLSIINAGEAVPIAYDVTSSELYSKTAFHSPINSKTVEIDTLTNAQIDVLAFEVFEEGQFVTTATDISNINFLNFVKKIANMSTWQGDPCIPVPDSWVACSSSGEDNDVTLRSLILSNVSDISRLIEYKSDQQSLFSLSITHSGLNSNVTQYLLSNLSDPGALQFLNLSFNSVTQFFDKDMWQPVWEGSIVNFNSMVTLDLSHNQVRKVPTNSDLDFLFYKDSYGDRSDTLQFLNLSNNYMQGLFSFDSFLNSSTFKILNADYNPITTLNLTMWYNQIQGSLQSSTKIKEENFVFHKLFSFVHNNIASITPALEDFESLNIDVLIQSFQTFSGGVLLGGNPYCKDAKAYFQKYLCRFSIDDYSYEINKKKKSSVPIYAGVFGGLLLLVVGCIIILTFYKLQKQVQRLQNSQQGLQKEVQALQSFQQELLNRKVQPPFFSFNDLKIATNDFHDDNKLGRGASGVVYKGELQDKTFVAVKRLLNDNLLEEQVLSDFLNEVVLLTGIKHKNLVQLLGCCINNEERILVYEYAERGDVAQALWGQQTEGILSWKTRLTICLGVARGLAYLHEELQPRIIHRDIKALNILLDTHLNPKIADFGLAKSFKEEETRAAFTMAAGTIGYWAPEYVLDGLLTEKADVYSFGMVLLEMISGRKCVDKSQPEDQVSLKHWAEDLDREGKSLELLQSELQEKCPPHEVTRTISIALLCVDTAHKRRPSMSEAVIMLAEVSNEMILKHLTDTKNEERLRDQVTSFNIENEGDGGYEYTGDGDYEYTGDRGSQWIPASRLTWTGAEEGMSSNYDEEDALVPRSQTYLAKLAHNVPKRSDSTKPTEVVRKLVRFVSSK